jgi:DNA polymerase III delta prime subunit
MFDSLTHHAYALTGEAPETVPALLSALKKSTGMNVKGNPDVHIESYEVMGIDESRSLKEAATRKAVTGGKKVFVMSAERVTKEAQNALLKLFEEPAADTHFFLIVPSLDILLGTLRSRLFVLTAPSAREKEASGRARDFLRSEIPMRLKTIQKLLKNAEEEGGKKELNAFLGEIERNLASDEKASNAGALREALLAQKYARDRAPSFKLLLEHLALVLPKN